MELFNYYPPHLREQVLETVKGQRAVRFPAAYFRKAPQSMHTRWLNVVSLDSEGYVVKTGPNYLVNLLIKYLEKTGVDYEVIKL